MFENYSAQQLRDAIEIELKHCNDIKQASYNAMARLKENSNYYGMNKAVSAEYQCPKCHSNKVQNAVDRSTGAMFQTCLECRYKKNGKNSFDLVRMEKARVTKYIRRVPKPNGKGYYYFYSKAEFDRYKKTGETPKSKIKDIVNYVRDFFGIQDDKGISIKLENDYKAHNIEQKTGLDIFAWLSHLNEYFEHKEYWDSYFQPKDKKGKKEIAEKKKTEPKKPQEGKPSNKTISVMKLLHEMYGDVKPAPVQKKKPVKAEPAKQPEKEKGEEMSFEPKKSGEKLPASVEWMKSKAKTTEAIEDIDGNKFKIIEERFVGNLPYRMRQDINNLKFNKSYHDADGNEVWERAFNVLLNNGNTYDSSRYIKITHVKIKDEQRKEKAIKALPEKKKEVVQSDNFKNWFGDWEKDPANASKVVDRNDIPEEQKPLKVFHGTARGGFTEFNKKYQKGGLYGDGFYFTADEEIAKSYASTKDATIKDDIAASESFLADGHKIEYVNDVKMKKELDELKNKQYKNGNWDDSIIAAFDASFEKGKGYDIEKVLREYVMQQELKGRDTRTTGQGKEIIFSMVKKAFPKEIAVTPQKSNPEVFDVYLNIKNPLDLDGDMSQAEEILNKMKEDTKERARKSVELSIEKEKKNIALAIKYGENLADSRSEFYTFTDIGPKYYTLEETSKMSDKQIRDLAEKSSWELRNPDIVTHFKHLTDTLPEGVLEKWADKKGYLDKENKMDNGRIWIGDGDIPGTIENVYEIADLIAKHGLGTYDSATKTHGVKRMPTTKDGKPTLQHLAYILGDGGWSFKGGERINEWAKSKGYDGLCHTGGWNFTGAAQPEHKVWIAFDPKQIKSSSKNEGTFDSTKENMFKAITDLKKALAKPAKMGNR